MALRIAVISDIHGNRFALDAALEEIEGEAVDTMVCLGDTIQGGPQPRETAEKLRDLKIPVVMGNADAWLLGTESDTVERTSETQRDVRKWTLSMLTVDDLRFVRTFRPTITIDLNDGRSLLCFHGSPNSFDDLLRPDTPQERWDELLGPHSPSLMAGGHTHTQQMRRIQDGLFFNPGSIGVAFNALGPEDKVRYDPWAEYAILTYDRGVSSLEFRRAAYDLDGFIRVVEASGRPHAEAMVSDYKR